MLVRMMRAIQQEDEEGETQNRLMMRLTMMQEQRKNRQRVEARSDAVEEGEVGEVVDAFHEDEPTLANHKVLVLVVVVVVAAAAGLLAERSVADLEEKDETEDWRGERA